MSTTMIATRDAVAEARERLIARARREGLATIGYHVVDSPLGPLWIAVGPKGVATIHYGREPDDGGLRRLIRLYGPGIVPEPRRTAPLARELDEYFEGRRRAFDLPIDLDGLSAFQRRALRALLRVPYGALTTYRRVAAQAGNPLAPRAAGRAVGSNPIPIVVPCHRVVASDGTLGGYGGGLEAKRLLLALERGDVPPGGWPKRAARPRGAAWEGSASAGAISHPPRPQKARETLGVHSLPQGSQRRRAMSGQIHDVTHYDSGSLLAHDHIAAAPQPSSTFKEEHVVPADLDLTA